MDKESILIEKLSSPKFNKIFSDFRNKKELELFDSYSVEDIMSMGLCQMRKIKQMYINEEKQKRGILKYDTYNKECYKIKGYTDDEVELEIKNRKQNISDSPYKIDTYLKKGYTQEEAEFLVKSKRSTNKEYWISRGFSEEESIEKVKEHQSKSAKAYRTKYRENPEKYEAINTNQKKYWINKGFSEEGAIKKVSERQRTFTLEKCIEKYGEEQGIQKWKDRQNKWKKSLANNFEKNGDGRSPQSLWAKDIISELCIFLNIDVPKKEKYITSKETHKHYSYDFCYKNKIIEFNGDYWHCNPIFWKHDSYNSSIQMTAAEKWKFDEEKVNCAKSYNYNVLVIWENEYNENEELAINKCIKFLSDES
ncbi:hypothetical protein [uncultured Methanobrevibacter sp.]|uniref:hypothetical protein n=1 Tax=uncultured Methanobrevibacter sp. TaxID=253161 RepID=UPI0025F23FDF|nr:hypothetical protein [uncultured Methanobrevibacter sp.]